MKFSNNANMNFSILIVQYSFTSTYCTLVLPPAQQLTYFYCTKIMNALSYSFKLLLLNTAGLTYLDVSFRGLIVAYSPTRPGCVGPQVDANLTHFLDFSKHFSFCGPQVDDNLPFLKVFGTSKLGLLFKSWNGISTAA